MVHGVRQVSRGQTRYTIHIRTEVYIFTTYILRLALVSHVLIYFLQVVFFCNFFFVMTAPAPQVGNSYIAKMLSFELIVDSVHWTHT